MADNKWSKPAAPPPPLFFNKKEKDLVKKVNDELIERIIGQQVVYYPIDAQRTNYHHLYGEAIKKTFLPPLRVYVLIDWEGAQTVTDKFGVDRKNSLTIHFHKRRLTEDQDLWVQEGDFIRYGDEYFEIVELNSPRELFGQSDTRIEISAKCIKSREAVFDAK